MGLISSSKTKPIDIWINRAFVISFILWLLVDWYSFGVWQNKHTQAPKTPNQTTHETIPVNMHGTAYFTPEDAVSYQHLQWNFYLLLISLIIVGSWRKKHGLRRWGVDPD